MKRKKLLCALLAAALVCSLLPITALAYDPGDFANTSWFGQLTGRFTGSLYTFSPYRSFR